MQSNRSLAFLFWLLTCVFFSVFLALYLSHFLSLFSFSLLGLQVIAYLRVQKEIAECECERAASEAARERQSAAQARIASFSRSIVACSIVWLFLAVSGFCLYLVGMVVIRSFVVCSFGGAGTPRVVCAASHHCLVCLFVLVLVLLVIILVLCPHLHCRLSRGPGRRATPRRAR